MKSKYRFVFGLVTLALLSPAAHLCAQDTLRTHRIAGLRKLPEVAIVFLPGDRKCGNAPGEGISDIALVFLKAKIPVLKLSDTENSSSWLEVEYRTQTDGGLIRVALYRWVIISSTGERVFTARLRVGRRGQILDYAIRPRRSEFRTMVSALIVCFSGSVWDRKVHE